MNKTRQIPIRLRNSVTCPHCWHDFSPEDTVWVSQHLDLRDDIRLEDGQPLRFTPTRFTVQGNAIDSGGVVCEQVACPRCHLVVPRALFEMPPLFVSITGTPSCGKSYFLAAMTWQLRRIMAKSFAMSFADADPALNRVLNSYEENLFLNPEPDKASKLNKTEEGGDLYNVVRYDKQNVTYPKPFLFTIKPSEHHPKYHQSARSSRIISVYDNAGESFEPGKDSRANPVTRHLARSNLLMFLFDPTQDPRFRDTCRLHTQDPQVVNQPVTARQETVIHEIADRIRNNTSLGQNEKHTRPLLVVVTKYDAWWRMFGEERLKEPWDSTRQENLCALNLSAVLDVSRRLRDLLWEHCPELVSSAESFAKQVYYLPVSSTGCGPESDAESGIMKIRPKDIRPMWAETPLLFALSRFDTGMIAHSDRSRNNTKGNG